MHTWHKNPRLANRGLTLLELVVVLAILAILAGILVAKPDLLTRANNVAWMNNLIELDKAIAGYAATHYGRFPDGMDSLVEADGTIYDYLPGGTSGTLATTYLEVRDDGLTQSQLNRLNRAGITTVQTMVYGGFGATYFCYGSGKYSNPLPLEEGSKLVFLKKPNGSTYLYRPNKIQFDDTHEYVLLGIGQACALMQATGGWSKDCPVLRHPEGCLDPTTAYSRACAIFDLGVPFTGSGQDKYVAKFIGTVCLGDTSLKFSDEMINIPERLE